MHKIYFKVFAVVRWSTAMWLMIQAHHMPSGMKCLPYLPPPEHDNRQEGIGPHDVETPGKKDTDNCVFEKPACVDKSATEDTVMPSPSATTQ